MIFALIFWSSLDFGDKSSSSFGEDLFLFFVIPLVSSSEKNSGQASFPQYCKQGKIGVKLQIILPNAQHKSAPLLWSADY